MQILLFIWLIAICVFGLYMATGFLVILCRAVGFMLKAMTEGDMRIREAYGYEKPKPKRKTRGNVIYTKEFSGRG